MPTTITLNDLVEAIADAVIQAQDQVERYQTSLLRSYFDKDNRPRYVRLRVPSLREGADAHAEEELVVPVLALVGATRLAIKELEVSTTVTLGDVADFIEEGGAAKDEGAEGEDEDVTRGKSGPRRGVRVDLGASASDPSSATASLKLNLQAIEPTEGLTRVMIELNKRIRSFPKT